MKSLLVSILSILSIVFALYISYTAYVEAYGQGAPYYGRTTNMDKWQSPWPLIIGVNLTAAFIITLLLILKKKFLTK